MGGRGARSQCPKAICWSRPSAPNPAQTSNLELGTGGQIDRPTLHPAPQSRAELGPGQRWADPERLLASEVSTGTGRGRPAAQPAGFQGPGQGGWRGSPGRCMGAQARLPQACSRDAVCPARRTGLPASALETLRSVNRLCASEGLGTSTSDAEVGGDCGSVGGRSFHPSPARSHLGAPSRDPTGLRPRGVRVGGRVSAGGLKAPSSTPPFPSPVGAKGGEGATLGQSALLAPETRKEPHLVPCLSFPTSSSPECPEAPGPAPLL